jgi:2-polyprenyl-3-methyl-5-hydroxy-6-metoxy-1,4-benzoquinol methylase
LNSMDAARNRYAEYWEAAAPPPENDPLTEERVQHFLRLAPEARTVLDLGCGNGRASRMLADAGKRVVGLDIASAALRKAAAVGASGSVCYVEGSCEAQFPFRAESIDAIYCAEVIEHLVDPQTTLAECRRVLRPGGTLFVSTPYHGWLKNILIASVGFERHFDPSGPHIRFFTPRSLASLMRLHGFSLERTICLGRFWPLWMNMAVVARRA